MINLRENIWATEVPDYGKCFEICKDECEDNVIAYKGKTWLREDEYMIINLPPGTWEIVCTSKDKKIPNGIVECKTVEYDGSVQGTRFVNYMNHNQRRWFINKTDSLRSLLTSKGCDVNKNWLILKKTA